jgi:ADP-heptose:LPS heptosyltransferase
MTSPLPLPNVTLVAITTRDYGGTVLAIKKSLEQIKPHSTIFFTDVEYKDPDFECVLIPKMDWLQYNKWVCCELMRYITTTHVLLIQHDGYVLDASAWTDEFLNYDYIGAPWSYRDGRNVGNGGFSMRSNRLMHRMAVDQFIQEIGIYAPEDEVICRLYRKYLESQGIHFAPEDLAHRFSFEMHPPKQKTFGFHAHFFPPYREPVIVHRTGAMGDVIMAEPLMGRLYNDGYRVILDCLPPYYNLFDRHYFPIEFLPNLREDTSGYRVINLDMAYEIEPKKLVLESYYKAAGIKEYTMRNAKLNFKPTPETRLFDDYIVLHVDDTAMAHRNVHGVDWGQVATYINVCTKYKVFQIGGKRHDGVIHINTPTEPMLAYIIAGASYFIGIDSGPSQIAQACGVKSILFFGSVDARLRYHDRGNIVVFQKPCPIAKAGCYHSVLSEVGTPCEANVDQPPCITWTAAQIIEELNRIL